MINLRKVSKQFALLLILGLFFGIFSSVPVLETPEYLSKLSTIRLQVLFATFSQLGMAVTYLGITVLLYPLVKSYNKTHALAYFGFRMSASAFLFLGIIPLLTLLNISDNYMIVDQVAKMNYEIIGELVRIARDWLNHLTVIFAWSFGGVILYITMYKTKLIPRWMSTWALIATALTILATSLLLFDVIVMATPLYFIMNTPAALFDIILAIYLLRKGFDEEAFERR